MPTTRTNQEPKKKKIRRIAPEAGDELAELDHGAAFAADNDLCSGEDAPIKSGPRTGAASKEKEKEEQKCTKAKEIQKKTQRNRAMFGNSLI